MLNDGSLKSRLWKFRHFISVLLSNSAVADAFADYGIETQHILDYRQLYDRCLMAYFDTKNDRSSGLAVTEEIQAQINQVKRTYRQHLTLARHVMNSRDDQVRLEMRGPREDSTLGWIYQARAFYFNMGDAQLARLERFKMTRQRLDHVRLQLEALETELTAVHMRRAEMTRKTRERDTIFAEMAVAASDLEVVARVLSEDHPDLMGLLTRESRSNSNSNRSGSSTDPDPLPTTDSESPDLEPDDEIDDTALASLSLPSDLSVSEMNAAMTSAELPADAGLDPHDRETAPEPTVVQATASAPVATSSHLNNEANGNAKRDGGKSKNRGRKRH